MTKNKLSLRRHIELTYFRARGYFPIQLHGRDYKLQPEDRKFWRKVAAKQWEPHTFTIVDKFLDKSSVFVDLGAWIGPTVLYAAARCNRVYCFEPDPFAYERLLGNLRQNDIENVTSFHGAVYTRNGTANIRNPEDDFGNSETRIATNDSEGIAVPCITFEHVRELFDIETIDLIKMDIEGAEFELLPHMKQYLKSNRPSLYLSTHAPLFESEHRLGKMQVVAEIADMYTYCLDRHRQPLDRDTLLSAQFVDNFYDVIFTEKHIH